MTIQIDRASTAHTPHTAHPARATTVAVWDVAPETHTRAHSTRVRTLSPHNRTHERVPRLPRPTEIPAETAFESRHENRADILMGAVLGLALILGSAAGGAFSADPADQGHGAAHDVVSAQVR
ncbi:hypothetical protein SAMN04488535_0739 [Corynebacterium mycetoides]|uniref:Uncharacterized protein n=1 Tax=Corynebacterium mycetoides TaxID=38302 RepID=A0A1G9MT70_9CORY|nr:hypothetical protein SAMN04488535_0739 [Corynebacterium mycetoides]